MKLCKSVATDTLSLLPESMTVCATVDEKGDEQVITEMMIRRACEQMEIEQLWPFGDQSISGAFRAFNNRSATILKFPTQTANS